MELLALISRSCVLVASTDVSTSPLVLLPALAPSGIQTAVSGMGGGCSNKDDKDCCL